MIKLLIADDEENIRKGIRNNVDWEDNGIVVCGEAEDGDEALRLIHETNPDIIVIDIKMPGTSGLDVIEALYSVNHPAKSIIISGYDDFSFAQKALKLGALDYLLKPCRSRDILESVLKIKTEIELERTRKDVFDRFKSQFNANLPMLKEKILTNILDNRVVINKQLLNTFQLFRIKLLPDAIVVLVIKIIEFTAYCKNHSCKDTELLLLSIKSIISETLQTDFRCETLEYDNNIVVIINMEKDELCRLIQLCEIIKSNIKESLGFPISIGIGRACSNLESVSNSYYEALKSAELSFIMGPEVTIQYDKIKEIDKDNTVYPLNEEKNIMNAIGAGKIEDLRKRLDEYISLLLEYNSTEYIQKSCLALILSLYHLCLEKNIIPEDIFGCSFSSLDEILHYDTLDKIKDKLLDIIIKLTEAINAFKTSNKSISLALKFIEENYEKNLTLETIAQKVFVNPKYLSTLFKQVVGENFVDYIQRIRIEKACEMLKDVRLKIYEIAYKVGYTDDKYFCQVFKRIKGLTPGQYRRL